MVVDLRVAATTQVYSLAALNEFVLATVAAISKLIQELQRVVNRPRCYGNSDASRLRGSEGHRRANGTRARSKDAPLCPP